MPQQYATFEISQVTVPLPKGWYVHDEGMSKINLFAPPGKAQTIEGRELEVIHQYRLRYYQQVELRVKGEAECRATEDLYASGLITAFLFSAMSNSYVGGRTLKWGPIDFGKGEEVHIHLFYLDLGKDYLNLRTRAHEEQHAIAMIPGGIELLEDRIATERGKPISFARVRDAELAADCNAVHALRVRGFDVEKIYQENVRDDSVVAKRFKRAMHIYDTDDYKYTGFALAQLRSSLRSWF